MYFVMCFLVLVFGVGLIFTAFLILHEWLERKGLI